MSAGDEAMAGRAVLVTGGSRGLGKGIAEAFLAAGADVVVTARNEPDALPASGDRRASFVAGDLREADQASRLVATAAERLGKLDVAVNNAGGSPPARVADASPRFLTSVLTLNLLAPLLVAKEANRLMQRQHDGGLIINISSLCGVRASPGVAVYGAAKAGLINLTESLAAEFAPRVRVNCVTPGALETAELHERYGGDAYFDAVRATVPLGRMGTPADVAAACLFLASETASFVTGSNLVVHGGGDNPPVP
jgi:NAD(P)-dependent dehydrogenase (short-subunit alcohol dehydrogenase family)